MKEYWIDSHAHLASERLFENFETIISNALEMEVSKINIICGNLSEFYTVLPLIEGNNMFDISLGVHPMEVNEVDETEFKLMDAFYNHPQVVCVGEIGLDYYWDETHKSLQKQRLIEQIDRANTYGLPVAIHLRDKENSVSAVEDLIMILKENPAHNRGIVHCYSDTVENAVKLLDMGYYLGFGGIVTFKNGTNVRDVLDITPIDRIIIETDSPYLAPVPMRGKTNQPAYVSYVGKHMNDKFGKNMRSVLMDNYYRLFNKSKKV